MKSWPSKDPDEILDFEVDWETDGALEGGEAILSSTWEVADGTVTILDASPHAPSFVDGVTKVWLSGGTLGETCVVTNHIITSAFREKEFSGRLKIKAK